MGSQHCSITRKIQRTWIRMAVAAFFAVTFFKLGSVLISNNPTKENAADVVSTHQAYVPPTDAKDAVPKYKSRAVPRPRYNSSNNVLYSNQHLSNSVTVVTAYFNLGRFQKGEDGSTFFEPSLYMHWLKIFSKIKNPVVAYFDTKQALDYFEKQRWMYQLNTTKAVLVKRDELWAFGLYSKIAKILSKPDYPRFEPNTVMPEYSSVMHAKYELMQQAIVENPFKTKFFCWLDVGLFRALAKEPVSPFYIHLPPAFNISRVAYTQVYTPFPSKIALEQIFYSNLVWVCGCFFIAEQRVMMTWLQEYMQYAEHMLDLGFTNSDQQVIYAIFNRGKPKTKIQTYTTTGKYNLWFNLGYLCKEELYDYT